MNLEFHGYWSDNNADYVPKKSGIYCIYAGTDFGNSCTLRNLLYIGESSNVGNKLVNLDKTELKEWLKWGETLYYSFAETDDPVNSESSVAYRNRQDIENQLLYENNPPFNSRVPTNSPRISLTLSGRDKFLKQGLTVQDVPNQWKLAKMIRNEKVWKINPKNRQEINTMLKAVNDVEAFNPSVFGLKDKPIDEKVPNLKFQFVIDDKRQIPGLEESRRVIGFNVHDAKDKFIGWLYVFIGGLGSLSYAEHKPGKPKEVFVYNQSLFAENRETVNELVTLSQKCARHYHEYLMNNSDFIKWIPIEVAMTELKPNLQSQDGV